jgi:hypothetical protein
MIARVMLEPKFHRSAKWSEYLYQRGISEESMDACGLRTWRPAVHAKAMDMAWLEAQDIEGGCIPFLNFAGKPTGFQRTRVFGNIKPLKGKKKAPKFLQAEGSGVHLYFPPLVDWVSIAKDPKIAILVTEGEVKSIAAAQLGFACLAVTGVECWSTKDDNGHSNLIDDFGLIDWQGREVFVAYDSDAVTNPHVRAAEDRLMKALYDLGAKPFVIRIPRSLSAKPIGLDDFLVGFDPPHARIQVGRLMEAAESPYVPRISTTEEIDQMNFRELDYVINPILPKGLGLLASPPKIGKSWLMLQAGHAIATGGIAFGSCATEQSEVLYLALEDGNARIKARMQQMELAPIAELRIAHTWPAGDLGLDVLERELASRPRLRVVFIDTWQKFRKAADEKRETAYQSDYRELGRLKALADKYDALILLSHHTKKGRVGDAFEAVLGSTAITGAVDATILLARERNGSVGSLTITGRDVQEQQLAMSFAHRTTCTWTIDGGTGQAAKASRRQQDFVDVLRTAGQPMRLTDIAEAVSTARGVQCSMPNASQTLARLITAGIVQQNEEKQYELVEIDEPG